MEITLISLAILMLLSLLSLLVLKIGRFSIYLVIFITLFGLFTLITGGSTSTSIIGTPIIHTLFIIVCIAITTFSGAMLVFLYKGRGAFILRFIVVMIATTVIITGTYMIVNTHYLSISYIELNYLSVCYS